MPQRDYRAYAQTPKGKAARARAHAKYIAKRRELNRQPKAGTKRSFNVPEGDKRLTVNVSKELHQKLKIAAVMAHTTVGELIEKFAKDQLDEMLRKGIK